MLDSNSLKPFNYVETIAILVCKQISFNSFKNEITDKTNLLHIYLNVYKQMIDVKLLLLHSNT